MTAVTVSCLPSTLSSPSLSPPSSPNSKPTISHSKNLLNSIISRRQSSLLLTFTPFLAYFLNSSPPAFAINLGISGPRDWLKEQKKKSIKYLLAPIYASDEILRHAYQLHSAKDSSFEQRDLEEIMGLLKSAARDCVAGDRNSVVAFQAKTGVEVCTFKLIVSNASSLLDDGDSTKLEAEARLSNLTRLVEVATVPLYGPRTPKKYRKPREIGPIWSCTRVWVQGQVTSQSCIGPARLQAVSTRSFTVLNDVAKETDFLVVSDRQKLANAVMDSLSSLHKFEQGIKECIGV